MKTVHKWEMVLIEELVAGDRLLEYHQRSTRWKKFKRDQRPNSTEIAETLAGLVAKGHARIYNEGVYCLTYQGRTLAEDLGFVPVSRFPVEVGSKVYRLAGNVSPGMSAHRAPFNVHPVTRTTAHGFYVDGNHSRHAWNCYDWPYTRMNYSTCSVLAWHVAKKSLERRSLLRFFTAAELDKKDKWIADGRQD